jgi:hypothetical protein
VSSEELTKIKGFHFVTTAKYDEYLQGVTWYKIQLNEMNNKHSKMNKLYIGSVDDNKAQAEFSNKQQTNMNELQSQMEQMSKLLQQGQGQANGNRPNAPDDDAQQTIQELTDENELLDREIIQKSSLLEDYAAKQEKLLIELNSLKKDAADASNSQESLLRQEILKREQVDKDFAKLEAKFNEVSVYLRQEVERSTGLVQKNEAGEVKYKKVKQALKDLAAKVTEQEATQKKNDNNSDASDKLVKI